MVSFTIHGIGVSGGIAIGRAQLVSHATLEVAHYAIPAAKVRAEVARFEAAVSEVQKELEALHGSMSGEDVPGEFGAFQTCPTDAWKVRARSYPVIGWAVRTARSA